MNHAPIVCALLASAGIAQLPTPVTPATLGAARMQASEWPVEHVLYDEPGDGRVWARGADWKASFGREGFTYLPRLPGAKRAFPLQFRLAAVRVGGQSLALTADAGPVRVQDRVSFDRGSVREVYDLRPAQVEQTFVVATELAGDVEVDLTIASELAEDPTRPGLQFACSLGEVAYGDAFLVCDQEQRAIVTEWTGSTIRLRVPAALRGPGPVVIDPILSTQNATTPGLLSSPDVAYDATNDRYLVVWEAEFGEFDHDVFSVMFDALGNLIPGSWAPIDISTLFVSTPRVASLNQVDRFLVVTVLTDPGYGNRRMIYGRTRDAGGSMALNLPVLLSDPNTGGNNHSPAIGADPGTGPGNHDWLVVWVNPVNATESRIQGRLVRGDGQPRSAAVLPIQNGANQWNGSVQISRSNGNGRVSRPEWFVVYGRTVTSTNSDVFGRRVDPAGLVGAELPIETSSNDEKDPHVSSPVDHGADGIGFLVTYERPLEAIAPFIRIKPNGTTIYQYYYLNQHFGAGRYTPRVDSDGIRYVVTTSLVNPGSTLPDYTHARTLAWQGSQLVQQDGPHPVPGAVSQTRIASNYSSGGPSGDYAFAYMRLENGLKQPMLTRYAGQTPGAMTAVLPTACDGLAIAVRGSTALGNSVQFELSNHGSNIPGFLFGGASVIPFPICSPCSLGVRLDLPIEPLLGAPTLSLPIPPTLGLIGQSFAIQGLSVGAGSCLSAVSFSDTIQCTIR